jgi:predicted phosphodiesterase
VLALDAVLAELGREPVDEIVCLGDVAVGPQPVQVLERIEAFRCRVVMGNWDAWFLDGFPTLAGDAGSRLVELGTWWVEKLSRPHLEYMRSFEPMVELSLATEATLLAFHGSPRSFEDAIFATTPVEELERMLSGFRASVFAGGHTHFQMMRRHGDAIIVNPGSVGLPFYRPAEVMQIAPWAEYGLVTFESGRFAIELRRISFDVDAFIRLMLSSGMPHAEWWAGLWVTER